MVLAASWNEFEEGAKRIFSASPDTCRYVMKYRAADKQLTCKVTDDAKCITFRTDEQTIQKRADKLQMQFMALMASGDE